MTLAHRLRRQLERSAGSPVPRQRDVPGESSGLLRPAAVLMAVTDRAEPGIILTQRPDTMPSHAGQVAFPGGKVDDTDADMVAAALREAEEEIALPRDRVEIVGVIAPYHTITGFVVAPVLAVIPPDLPLVPHDREVAAIFEAPLHHVTSIANYTERQAMVNGQPRSYIDMMWQGRRIWGATAAMLVNLGARLA